MSSIIDRGELGFGERNRKGSTSRVGIGARGRLTFRRESIVGRGGASGTGHIIRRPILRGGEYSNGDHGEDRSEAERSAIK